MSEKWQDWMVYLLWGEPRLLLSSDGWGWRIVWNTSSADIRELIAWYISPTKTKPSSRSLRLFETSTCDMHLWCLWFQTVESFKPVLEELISSDIVQWFVNMRWWLVILISWRSTMCVINKIKEFWWQSPPVVWWTWKTSRFERQIKQYRRMTQ